jgi:N-methylhydantoinase A/oxoprolinase/acetone carboxylase beta subunit
VEGKGRPVALFLIGYDQELVHKFQLQSNFVTSNYYFFLGGHDLNGEEQAPLDLEAISKTAAALKGEVDAFAVSGYFSPLNTSHEESAFRAIYETTGLPVVLGHQLSSKLDSIQRATTAIINASLLSILQEFIRSMRRSLHERQVDAPLKVVKGDGTFMSSLVAEQRPVDTIHSGPAASAIGGQFLASLEPALVIDIGGTTTDMAVVDQGHVTINEEGSLVGHYRTAVRAARVRSLGLGGDSYIGFDLEDRLTIGPVRVTPISYLAHIDPRVAQALEKLPALKHKRLTLDHMEYWFLQREPGHALLNDQAREVIEMLRKQPLALPDILERLGVFHPLQFGGSALINQEIVGRAAFTPTDLLHLNGKYAPWNKNAAEIAAWLIEKIIGLKADDLIEKVMRTISEQIAAEVVSFLSSKSVERASGFYNPDNLGAWLFEENINRSHPFLGSKIELKIPVIGIGAPARIFLPGVAEMLHTELIIPVHYDVANAVGAVAGSVIIYEDAWVFPQNRGLDIVGYYVQSGGDRKRFEKLDPAREYAQKITGEKALAKANGSGVIEPELKFEQLPEGVESYRIRARVARNTNLIR